MTSKMTSTSSDTTVDTTKMFMISVAPHYMGAATGKAVTLSTSADAPARLRAALKEAADAAGVALPVIGKAAWQSLVAAAQALPTATTPAPRHTTRCGSSRGPVADVTITRQF